MNDVNSPADSDKNAQTEAANNARRVTYYLIGAALLLWVYTLWADRFTPMTNHGRINGQLIRITPQVSGPIARITVLNNAEIRRGQPLLNIEQHPFQLEVSAAKLVLQQATLSVRSDSAAIEAAKANQVAARVKLINATQHAQRNKTLARRNVISKSTLDDSIAAQNSAQAVLSQPPQT
nr:biotin/lipoyl-binding protein [Enterovibrio nigricans]